MEVAGLVIGLAALYSACTEAVNRIESYRDFETETRQLSAQFRADRAILQRWATRTGLSSGAGLEIHDQRLNNPEIALAVRHMLLSIQTVLKAIEGIQGKLRLYNEEDAPSFHELQSSKGIPNTSPISSRKRDKFRWTFGGKEKLTALIESFGVCVRKLNDLVPLDGTTELSQFLKRFQEIGLEVDKVLQRFKDKDKEALLSWVGPAQNDDRYESCKARRTPNTCSWIFSNESYIKWRSTDFPRKTPKFLWIHGSAGHGKSVTCAAIVESLQQDSSLQTVQHFFVSSSKSQEDFTSVLKSLIAQMVATDDHLLDLAVEAMPQYPRQAGKRSLWKLFTDLVNDGSGWTFVLDGIDECQLYSGDQKQASKEDRSSFLADLQTAIADTPSRVLVVSRDEPDIRSLLSATESESNTAGPMFLEHELTMQDVKQDILKFSKSVVDLKLANKSDSIRDDIAEKMAVKCCGMFLWIDLQKRHLRSGKNKLQLQQVIEEMPNGLELAYERNWNDIMALPSDDRERALSILRWAIFAARPLTVAETAEALLVLDNERGGSVQVDYAPDLIDEEYITSEMSALCGSLLEIYNTGQPPELRTVQLRHFSVKQFLLTKDMEWGFSDVYADPQPHSTIQNNHLAIICLHYLRDKNVQEDLRTQGGQRAFADYAVEFWPQHVSRMGARYAELSHIIIDFFTQEKSDWRLWRSRLNQLQTRDQLEDESAEEELPSPVYYAAWFGLEQIVTYLCSENSATIDSIGGVYGTPTKAAYAAGHVSLAVHMVELGADLNIAAGRHGSLLGSASRFGDLKVCKYLVNQGASLLLRDELGGSPLYLACKHGHAEVVEFLLAEKADVSAANLEGTTPIHVASGNGHVQIVELLIKYDADVSVPDKTGQTPLFWACLNSRTEVFKLLLQHEADLSATDIDKRSLLHVASSFGCIDIVKLLLEHQVSPLNTNQVGLTPLTVACWHGHVEVVKLFLEHEADCSINDDERNTSLHLACRRGFADVVKALLEYRADPSNAANGWTPIYLASENGHHDVAKLLLEHGADASIPCDGWTPLYIASENGHTEVVRLLLDYRTDSSAPSIGGRTPMYIASRNGDPQVVKLLLDNDNDASASVNGWTPIYLASKAGHAEVVKLLLEHHADFSVPNYGRTPISIASENGHTLVVKLLLDHHADPSISDNDGWTPLHAAAFKGHSEIVDLLLRAVSNVDAMTSFSETSLHFASRCDRPEIVDLLMAGGCNPLLLDDYGRNCLDWASMCPQFVVTKDWFNHYQPTSKAVSGVTLKRTILRLIDQALGGGPQASWGELGRCLVFFGDEHNAIRTFEHMMSANSEVIQHPAICDRCSSSSLISGYRYICRSCVDVDLCQLCFETFRKDERPWRCQSHDFIRIPRDETNTKPYVGMQKKELKTWLRDVRNQYA